MLKFQNAYISLVHLLLLIINNKIITFISKIHITTENSLYFLKKPFDYFYTYIYTYFALTSQNQYE